MNKYNRVFETEIYKKNRELVYERYNNTFQTMPVINKKVNYNYYKKCISGVPKKVTYLSEAEKTVLETIFVGKCMTIDQLLIYLLMKGYYFSISRLKSVLDKLMHYKLIQRITVTGSISDDSGITYKYYMIGEYTPCIKMGIPNVTAKQLFMLRKECGSNWPMYCISMQIINQILINQLIYNDDVNRFIIGDVKMYSDYQLTIPLILSMDDVITAFTFVMFMDTDRIETILSKWLRYRKQNDKKIRLILIVRDDAQQLFVMKKIEYLKYKELEIGYTKYTDWFSDINDRIYIKTSVRALGA